MKGQGRIGGPMFARATAVITFAVLALGLSGGRAAAQDDEPPQSIRGRVFNEIVEGGKSVRDPVADVTVLVETEAGAPVGEAVTDAEGAYAVPLSEPGTYVIRIDAASLPEDLAVQEGQDEATVTVRANGQQTRVFFLGESGRETQGRWDRLPQVLANGVKLAMIVAITSVGLSLIFGTTGLSNFAHGEMVTFGAILAFYFNANVGWQLIPAAIIAVALSAVLGFVFNGGVWRPLRSRKTGLTSMMIVSIGIALAARYLFLYLFGADVEAYRQYTLQSAIDVGPFSLTARSLIVIGLSVAILVTVALFLLRARFGKAIRAVSDNPELASSTGINTERVIAIVWILAGALAGIGGVFYGLEFQVRWDMGFTLLLMMFAAITLGGLGNPFGALLGSLVIGIFVELWTWIVPRASDLKTVGALVGLILILLIRPQGILGSKERIG
jgi:branched-chain amino acid transport system permease protein